MKSDLEDWEDGVASVPVGAASTLSLPGTKRPKREFPPGFHGANPGPSFEEEGASPTTKKRQPRVGTRKKKTV